MKRKERTHNMRFSHINHGTCSRSVSFDIDGERKLRNVEFSGGCSGNTQGICRLAEGMDAAEAMERMSGIRCGYKPTSCPDQLAEAIKQALEEIKNA